VTTRFDLVLARVSDDPAAVARFLKTLGFRAENGASSVVVHGRSGKVAVLSTVGLSGGSAGDTRLSLAVSNAQAAAGALAKARHSPVELHGRVRIRHHANET
jgi:hypothetical protein